MKKILMLTSIGLAIVGLVSCGSIKSEKQAFPEPIILTHTKEVKVIEKDTIFKVEADSSFYKAYIDCRDGKPKIINPKSQKGREMPVPEVNIDKHGNLSVRARTEAKELFKKWKETHTQENVPKPIYVDKVVYKKTPFTWYHKALMWSGGLFLFLIGAISLATVIRLYKR